MPQTRQLWNRCVRPLWRDHQWLVIGAFWAVTFAIAYVGVRKQLLAAGELRSVLDPAYCAFQLFIMQDLTVGSIVSWQLEVTRFLAPMVAAYTAFVALVSLLGGEMQLLALRRFHGHVIICGLGQKGLRLAEEFRDRGERVVVLEQDEENDSIEPCRDAGAIVLIGDASGSDLLARAGVARARWLICVCGEDGTNAAIAVQARELVGREGAQALICLVHIVDPQLCALLKDRESSSEQAQSFRLAFFNVFESGSRALLDEYPPFDVVGSREDGTPHLLVVGLGAMGSNVVVNAVQRWRATGNAAGSRLHIGFCRKNPLLS